MTHRCSFAFSPNSSIVRCAKRHCGAKWLIKMDVTNFFGSISEIQVYHVFREIGYSPLVSFEMARLTTCLTKNYSRYSLPQWQSRNRNMVITEYRHPLIGHLPQGAPTSPMLSNLVMRAHDAEIKIVADVFGVTYTRYSDDIAFSARNDFSRRRSRHLIREVKSILVQSGFRINNTKTVVVPPGARKIVLGLNVDSSIPRLPKDYRSNLRQHLYYLNKLGPVAHRDRRDFESMLGMKHHIRGLIDFARMVDSVFGQEMQRRFDHVPWPV